MNTCKTRTFISTIKFFSLSFCIVLAVVLNCNIIAKADTTGQRYDIDESVTEYNMYANPLAGWLKSKDGASNQYFTNQADSYNIYAEDYPILYINVACGSFDSGNYRSSYSIISNNSTNQPIVLKKRYDESAETYIYESANVEIGPAFEQDGYKWFSIKNTNQGAAGEELYFLLEERYIEIDESGNPADPSAEPNINTYLVGGFYYFPPADYTTRSSLDGIVCATQFDLRVEDNVPYFSQPVEFTKYIRLSAGYTQGVYLGTYDDGDYAVLGGYNHYHYYPNTAEPLPQDPYSTALADLEDYHVYDENGNEYDGLIINSYSDEYYGYIPAEDRPELPGFYTFRVNRPGKYHVVFGDDYFNIYADAPHVAAMDVAPTLENILDGANYIKDVKYRLGQAREYYVICKNESDFKKDSEGNVRLFLSFSDNPDLPETSREITYDAGDIHIEQLSNVLDYKVYKVSFDETFCKWGYFLLIFDFPSTHTYGNMTNAILAVDSEGHQIFDGVTNMNRPMSHTHVTNRIDAVAPTSTTSGNTLYYACSCGKFFSDAYGEQEILQDSWIIPALGNNNIVGTTNNPSTTHSPTTVVQAQGTILTSVASNGKFTVTSQSAEDPQVEYAAASTDKNAKKISVPTTVKDANGVTYKVTSIADKAFHGMKNVTSITVGKDITGIGNNVFKGCSKLSKIVINSTSLNSKNVSKNAFKGIKSNVTIKVPKKMVKKYQKLFYSKGLSKKVKIKG